MSKTIRDKKVKQNGSNLFTNYILPLLSYYQPKINRKIVLVPLVIGVVAVLIYLSNWERVEWHISAILRLIMIKLLPIWNWQNLTKSNQCLIGLFGDDVTNDWSYNCALCEIERRITKLEKNIDYEFIEKNYIELDRPFLIDGHLEKWPNTSDIIMDLIDDLIISKSFPCDLMTNLLWNPDQLISFYDLFQQAINHDGGFMLAIRNCDHYAMRAFRAYFPCPTLLTQTPQHTPTLHNRLIWQRNYGEATPKLIPLRESLALIGGVSGHAHIHLEPIHCPNECQSISTTIGAGEALVVTSAWDVWYEPIDEENIVVILEMH